MTSLRVKEVRNKFGLSVAKFAQKMQEKEYKIRDIENGKQRASDDTLTKIGLTFNVNLNWLLTGEGEMFLNSEKDENTKIEEYVLDIFKVVYNRAVKTKKINLLEECLFECGQKIK